LFIGKGSPLLKLSDFDYQLPPELVAQHPAERRDRARLLVLQRDGRSISHHYVEDLPFLLKRGDLLVLNDTKVVPAKLIGRRKTGGLVQALIVNPTSKGPHRALMKARGMLLPDEVIRFEGGALKARLVEKDAEGLWTLEFEEADLLRKLEKVGRAPLPPYIKRPKKADPFIEEDRERYQTVFARDLGAVAAPTAGLHFTRELLEAFKSSGVSVATVTLHTGLGTFHPIWSERVEEHKMHSEAYFFPGEAARKIAQTKAEGGRVVAVGTTVVRVLETVARSGALRPSSGFTDLFIYPPFEFKIVDVLFTNFHLPKSTLIILASAFAGREFLLEAYREAIAKKYRFFSYGDAMLIF